MVNDKGILEAKRIEALYTRDGSTYRSLCDALGYSRVALENPELYDSASRPQQPLISFDGRRRVGSIEDLNDFDLIAVSRVLEEFVSRAHKNNVEGDRVIASRLRRISRIGCPVPNYSSLKGPEIFQTYMGIKDAVLQELRKRKAK